VWPRPSEVLGEQGKVRGHGTTKGELITHGRPTSKNSETDYLLDQQLLLAQSALAGCGYITAAGAAKSEKPTARNINIFMTPPAVSAAATAAIRNRLVRMRDNRHRRHAGGERKGQGKN